MLVSGDCLDTVESLVDEALRAHLPGADGDDEDESDSAVTDLIDAVTCERVSPEKFAEMVKGSEGASDGKLDTNRVHGFRWIAGEK